ncbi:hypothetical protein BU15DRAFT_68127 [Melanogaster broomeanus]|nr:hypothetical protein BU15DRAFT_69624 [Melanogaster broomeanus]KAF9231692.1 hypothetical protein BU15DRAFT_68127 [Melanogaster broomeanus]
MADGISLAVPVSSPNELGVETSTDETTNETTAPLSLPLEGERDSPAMNGSTRAYSEGAEPPDDTADVQGATQSLRCTNGTRTGQQHGAKRPSSRHEWNGCKTSGCTQPPDRIVEDPGGGVHPSMPVRPPSMPLEGEQGYQPSSGCAEDETATEARRAQQEAQQGYLEAEENRQYMECTRDHAPAPQGYEAISDSLGFTLG